MILFSNDFSYIIFVFPGLFYSLVSLFVWLIASTFILQKIDNNDEITITKIVTEFVNNFNRRPFGQRFSKGFFYLIIEVSILIIFQVLLLGEFFNSSGSSNFNGYFLLFMLITAILFEVFYQLDLTSTIFVFSGKIFSQFILVISFGLLLAEHKQSSFSDLSTYLVNHFSFIDLVLILLMIFSLSKLSTYMDYKKIPVFLTNPNDLVVYKNKVEKGNISENYTRWVIESFNQIVLSQFILLLLFPLIEQLLQLNGPLWVQFFLFIVFQSFLLLMALFLNLLNSIIEFKTANPQSKGIIFVLFLLLIFYLG